MCSSARQHFADDGDSLSPSKPEENMRFASVRLSPSMAVAILALFISLSGVTWAALRPNSVRSKQIKNGQVKSVDVRNDGLTGTDIREATLTGVTPAGPAGGALTGTYPSPAVAANTIGSPEVTDASLRTSDYAVASLSFSADLPSVAAQSCTAIQTTIQATQPGDLTLPFAEDGLETGLFAAGLKTTAAAAAKWRLCNLTGALIDPANHSYTVLVLR
jgi:hypothetical protein